MFCSFLVGYKKRGMKDRMDLPLGRDVEVEAHVEYDFFDFKWTGSLHLELLWSSHMKIGCFQPILISNFPQGEFCSYLLFHFLLSYLVGSLGIVLSSRKISGSFF